MGGECISQPDGGRVSRSIEPNIDVTRDEHGFDERRDSVQQVDELVEECRRNGGRAGMLDDSNDAGRRTRGHTDTEQLEAARPDTGVNLCKPHTGHGNHGDATVVRGQSILSNARPRVVHDLQTIDAQSSHADGVAVMPRLDPTHDVDRLVTANLEQVIHLAGQRSDVETAKHELSTTRRRVAVDVNRQQRRPSARRRRIGVDGQGRPIAG